MKEQADKLSSEEINREEYDNWRYHYPEFDTTQRWAKVPSQELSDALVEAFKDHLKDKQHLQDLPLAAPYRCFGNDKKPLTMVINHS